MCALRLKTKFLCTTIFNWFAILLLALFFTNCSKTSPRVLERSAPFTVADSAININSATADELEELPFVGAATAKRIINHREKYGAFRKPEYLLLVAGISDQRFREMRSMIKVE